MIKVLHVITDLNTGGAEKMLAQVIPVLKSGGIEQSVVCLRSTGPVAKIIEENGICVTCLNMKPAVPSYGAFRRLKKTAEDDRPDLIHSWLYHADLYASLVGRKLQIPVIWGLHNATLSPNVKLSTRLVVSQLAHLSQSVPRRIISCSCSGKQNHIDMGYRGDIITVIPNGFDTDRFKPNSEMRRKKRCELGISDDNILIGNISRFDSQKDHLTLIQAWKELLQKVPGIHFRFLLVGSGLNWENKELRDWICDAGLESRMLLLGERDDIPALLNAIDIFTLSSIGEAFPLALGEAMSSGLLCVTTDVGDAPYLLDDCGILVPKNNPAALAEAIRKMVFLSAEEQDVLRFKSRQRIIEHFSILQMGMAYIKVYQECLSIG